MGEGDGERIGRESVLEEGRGERRAMLSIQILKGEMASVLGEVLFFLVGRLLLFLF